MAKFTCTFKDPDYGVDNCELKEEQRRKLTDKYFEWNEYVTLEFDTETKAVRVVPVKEMKG